MRLFQNLPKLLLLVSPYHRKYIEKDTALERRFQPIFVGEPNENETIDILIGIRDKYVPAIKDDKSKVITRLFFNISGILPSIIFCAKPCIRYWIKRVYL